MSVSDVLVLGPSVSAQVREFAQGRGQSAEAIAEEAVHEGLAMLREKVFFEERAASADTQEARSILRRAGNEPPAPGDELPGDDRRDR